MASSAYTLTSTLFKSVLILKPFSGEFRCCRLGAQFPGCIEGTMWDLLTVLLVICQKIAC